MLGWPASTAISQPLAKKLVYENFQLNAAARARFDQDIRRMSLAAELSPNTVPLPAGDGVQAIYLLQVILRKADYDQKNLALLAKLIPQHLVFLLVHEDKSQLAIWQGRLFQGDWQPADSLQLPLLGLDLEAVWQGFVTRLGAITVEPGRSLDEQIALDARRQALERKIAQLEKKAWAEKQTRRKLALVEDMRKLQQELRIL